MSHFYRKAAAVLALACSVHPAQADWNKLQQSGALKVVVYNKFAPFSDHGAGIDVELAEALAKKLKLRLTLRLTLTLTLTLLPFPAGENIGDDLRTWCGRAITWAMARPMCCCMCRWTIA
jgi:ABC-type amino acid transport substrate-binding protein